MHTRHLFVALAFLPLLSGCWSKTVKISQSGTGAILQTDQYIQAMPVGNKVVDPQLGKEIWLGVAAMSGFGANVASGTATIHYFDSGTSVAGLNINVYPPAKGKFYEAWIAIPGKDPVSMGHLTSATADVRNQASLKVKEDLHAATSVFVTLEEDDGNPAAGDDKIAEGIVKDRTRQ